MARVDKTRNSRQQRAWAAVTAGALVLGGVVIGPATATDRSDYLVTISTDVPMPDLTVESTLATGDGFVVVAAKLTAPQSAALVAQPGVLGIETDRRVRVDPIAVAVDSADAPPTQDASGLAECVEVAAEPEPEPEPQPELSPGSDLSTDPADGIDPDPATQDSNPVRLRDMRPTTPPVEPTPADQQQFLTVSSNCPPTLEAADPDLNPNPPSPNPGPTDLEPRFRYPKYSWGIDSLDSVDAPDELTPNNTLDELYRPPSDGAGVHVYTLDTGLDLDHREFAGRVGSGWDVLWWDGQPDDTAPQPGTEFVECLPSDAGFGHGTQVAGVIASDIYGVAKGATVHPVRVLDCAGTGYISEIILGLEWVKLNAERPAIVNMSLAGDVSDAVNTVVEELVADGIAVVAAAGNNGADACNYSPSSAPGALTVAATDYPADEAGYSNYGQCVDLFAPGTAIRTSIPEGFLAGGSGPERTDVDGMEYSGTSLAAPHVAGALAVYWSMNTEATLETVTDGLIGTSKTNAVTLQPDRLLTSSPNRLLSVRFTAAPASPPPPPAEPPPAEPPTGNPPPSGSPNTTGTSSPPTGTPVTQTTSTTRNTSSNPTTSSTRSTFTPSSSYADPVVAETYATEYYQTSPYATEMPYTGGNPTPPTLLALALLGLGIGLLVVRRRVLG